MHLSCNYFIMLLDVSNNTVTTMASETTLFNKRIDMLIQIANILVNNELVGLLKALRERVCSTGNLNSGGKFEWIDSILVKVSLYFIQLINVTINFFFLFITVLE